MGKRDVADTLIVRVDLKVSAIGYVIEVLDILIKKHTDRETRFPDQLRRHRHAFSYMHSSTGIDHQVSCIAFTNRLCVTDSPAD